MFERTGRITHRRRGLALAVAAAVFCAVGFVDGARAGGEAARKPEEKEKMSGPPEFMVEPGPELAAYRTRKGTYLVPITVDGLKDFPPGGAPVRCGVPLPLGLIRDPANVKLLDSRGREVLVQAKPTGYWHDGSIKWLLLDWLARGKRYRAEVGKGVGAKPTSPSRGR